METYEPGKADCDMYLQIRISAICATIVPKFVNVCGMLDMSPQLYRASGHILWTAL